MAGSSASAKISAPEPTRREVGVEGATRAVGSGRWVRGRSVDCSAEWVFRAWVQGVRKEGVIAGGGGGDGEGWDEGWVVVGGGIFGGGGRVGG